MAITIPNQWTATGSEDDLEIPTIPTTGNWLIATVSWRATDGTQPLMSLGDYGRNIWTLLYDPTKFAYGAHDAAQLYTQVWACPAARYDGWRILNIYAAAMSIPGSDSGSVCVNVFEVAGMVNGHITVDSVTLGSATASASIALTAPGPSGSANCLMIATATADSTTSVNVTGTGWTGLTAATRTGPNTQMVAAWREATTTGTTTFTLTSGTANWAGCVVAIRTTGALPSQPNANWPITRLLVGLGYQLDTPLSAIAWTDQTSRLVDTPGKVSMHAPRGIPYDQGVVQAEQSLVAIRNDDGAYTPRTPGAATANAAGTTSTIKIPDASATNINKGDFFRLLTSTGARKELAIFQVTALASAAGTTTITFARADGGGVAQAATASGDRYSGVAVDLFMPWQMRMYWQGKWYPVATGWLGDLPQTWADAHWGQVPAAGIDGVATLTAADATIVRSEILRRNPTHYWPCDDPGGSGYAANASGTSNAILKSTTSKFGGGTNASADFGASTQAVEINTGVHTSITGDSGTGWQQQGLSLTDGGNNKGFALVANATDFPLITNGVTIVGAILTTDVNTGTGSYDPTIMIIRNADPAQSIGQGSILKLHLTHPSPNDTRITVWDKSTHATTTTAGPAGYGPSGLASQAQVWGVAFNQTSWTVYIQSQSFSGSANLPPTFSRLDVGGEADPSYNGKCWNAIHAHIAVFNRKLSADEFKDIYNAIDFGSVNLTLSQRVQRKLNFARWRGPRVITSESATAGADDTSASGAVGQAATEIAQYDDGLLFIDALAQLQFRTRRAGYRQLSKATLGENTAAGEIPYQPGQSYGFGTTYVYNDVEIENKKHVEGSGEVTQTFVAVDDTSLARYGQRSLGRTVRLQNAANAWDLGWWLLARYAYPTLRVEQVVIDAAAYPTAWAFCLGVEIGDLITVNRRPIGAPAISVSCRVLQVTPDIGAGAATFTLTLATAPPKVPLANDATLGVVGGLVVGA